MQKLFDLIDITLLELSSRPGNTIVKIGRLLCDQEIKNGLRSGERFIAGQFSGFGNEVFRIVQILQG